MNLKLGQPPIKLWEKPQYKLRHTSQYKYIARQFNSFWRGCFIANAISNFENVFVNFTPEIKKTLSWIRKKEGGRFGANKEFEKKLSAIKCNRIKISSKRVNHAKTAQKEIDVKKQVT